MAMVMVMTLSMGACAKTEPEPIIEPLPEPIHIVGPGAPINLVLATNADENGVVCVAYIEEVVSVGDDAISTEHESAEDEEGKAEESTEEVTEEEAAEEEAAEEEVAEDEIPEIIASTITATWDPAEGTDGVLDADGYIVTLAAIMPKDIQEDFTDEDDDEEADADTEEEVTEDEAIEDDAIDDVEDAYYTPLLYQQIDTTETTITFTNLAFTTEYTITVRAKASNPKDGSIIDGGVVMESVVLSTEVAEEMITTGFPSITSPDLYAEGISRSEILLSWELLPGIAPTGYIIRNGSTADTIDEALYEAAADETTCVCSELYDGTMMFFSIAAIFGDHEYPISDPVSATTKKPAPTPAPANSGGGNNNGGNNGGGGTPATGGGNSGGGGGNSGGSGPDTGGLVYMEGYFAQCGAAFGSYAEAERHANSAHTSPNPSNPDRPFINCESYGGIGGYFPPGTNLYAELARSYGW